MMGGEEEETSQEKNKDHSVFSKKKNKNRQQLFTLGMAVRSQALGIRLSPIKDGSRRGTWL